MSEETKAETEQAETVEQPETGEAVDWQAKYEAMRQHSRDWEKQAKANKAAADELEQLKAAQMTEQEKANARAEKAEAELAALKAEAARMEAAQDISAKYGVPLELLNFCKDRDAMEQFAAVYRDKAPKQHAAPSADGSRIEKGDGGRVDNGAIFADLVMQKLAK